MTKAKSITKTREDESAKKSAMGNSIAPFFVFSSSRVFVIDFGI
jgi:hypothetical protein